MIADCKITPPAHPMEKQHLTGQQNRSILCLHVSDEDPVLHSRHDKQDDAHRDMCFQELLLELPRLLISRSKLGVRATALTAMLVAQAGGFQVRIYVRERICSAGLCYSSCLRRYYHRWLRDHELVFGAADSEARMLARRLQTAPPKFR